MGVAPDQTRFCRLWPTFKWKSSPVGRLLFVIHICRNRERGGAIDYLGMELIPNYVILQKVTRGTTAGSVENDVCSGWG